MATSKALRVSLLLILLQLLHGAEVLSDSIGVLQQSSNIPLSASITNMGQQADYTFKFIVQKQLAAGATIEFDFPSQYLSGLGFSGTPTCSLGSCSVSGRKVAVTLTSAIQAGTATTSIIQSVTNPSSSGGTGNFKVYTKEYGNIIEQNTVFGTLGIAGAFQTLSSAEVDIMIDGTYRAGETTYVDFRFKVGVELPAGSWFKFIFPDDGFTINDFPDCNAQTIDRKQVKGNLYCVKTGLQVKVTGISETIEAGQLVLIRVKVTNPKKVITTGTFTIDTGRKDTNTIYERATNIPGITVEPGKISQVSLTPVDSGTILSQNKMVFYYLTFTTYNEIPQGGMITLTFPDNFNLSDAFTYTGDSANIQYQLESGLNDITYTNQITLAYSSTTRILTLSNFAALSAGSQVKIKLKLTNPTIKGKTDEIIISTYNDSNLLVDQNDDDAYTTIANLTAPTFQFATATDGFQQESDPTSNINMVIVMYPNTRVPEGGRVVITFPSAIDASAGGCTVFAKNKADSAPGSCTVASNIMTILLDANTAPLIPALDNKITITGVKAPNNPGYYLVNVETFSGNPGYLLESGAYYIKFVGQTSATVAQTQATLRIDAFNWIQLAYTLQTGLPTGIVPTVFAEIHSYIKIYLHDDTFKPGLYGNTADANNFDYTVGASIPCIDPDNSSNSLVCIYESSSSGVANYSNVIKVTNFASMNKSDVFKVKLFGLSFWQASPGSTMIRAYTLEKHSELLVDTGVTVNYTPLALSAAVNTSLTYTINNTTKINSTSNISFPDQGESFWNTGDAKKVYFFFMNAHEDSYCKQGNTVTLTVDTNSYTYQCTAQNFWLVFDLSTDAAGAAAQQISLSGLTNPSSVQDDRIAIFLEDGNAIQVVYVYSPDTAGKLTPGTITLRNVYSTGNYKGQSNVDYTIAFSIEDPIPSNSKVEIVFPLQFDLESSFPMPTCGAPNITPTTGSVITCAIDNNTITVSNIQALSANSSLEVLVYRVKNPNFDISDFKIYTYDSNNRLIDKNEAATPPALSTTFQPDNVTFRSIYAYPANQKAKSSVSITFSLPSNLPADGLIKISFPAGNFGTFASNASCRITGAVYKFKSCLTQGRAAFVTLATDLPANQDVTVYVNNVINPTKGKSANFDITTTYDDVDLHITNVDGTSDAAFLDTLGEFASIQVEAIEHWPINEGERGTYKFTVTPNVDISSSQTISIFFPAEYALELGYEVDCWAENLLGELSCKVDNARILDIKDFETFVSCEICSFTIYAKGIINPNYNLGAQTDKFRLGVREDRNFVQLNEDLSRVTFLPAPGLIQVNSATVANMYARRTNTFSFNFTTTHTVRRDSFGGAIWVRFPDEQILEGVKPDCRTSDFWASGVPFCSVDVRTVILNGQTSDFSGTLDVEIDLIPNPLYDGEAGSIHIKTYDANNLQIIDSSYSNLSPLRFTYTYGGPEIIVNSNQLITVRAGTTSNLIPISLDFPSALDMTITSDNENFSIIPYDVEFAIGQIVSYFQISVPSSSPANTYWISWVAEGDALDPYYAPLLNTQLIVTTTGTKSVTISNINNVPVGGESLPFTVTLENCPDVELLVNLELDFDYDGITLSTQQLAFGTAECVKNFTVSTDTSVPLNTVDPPSIIFSLAGANKHIFRLPVSSVDLNLELSSNPSPLITEITYSNVQQNSITLQLQLNIRGTLYYAVLLSGSKQLEFEDVKNQVTPEYSTTNTMYAVQYVYGTTATINLTNLSAQTSYDIQLYLEDTTQRASVLFTGSFTTLKRDPSAYFTLKFNEDYINPDDERDIEDALKLIFSLPDWRLVSHFIEGRRLQETSEMGFYIIDDPNGVNYPAPLTIANRINQQSTKFKSYIPYWDNSRPVDIAEIYMNPCVFMQIPSVDPNSAHSQIRVVSSLESAGYIHAIVELANQNTDSITTAQIAKGLNNYNQPSISETVKVTGNKLSELVIEGLTELTEYNVYVTCSNDYPGYPEPNNTDGFYKINWTTPNKPQPIALDLDFADSLSAGVMILLLLFA